jgi:small neutral amino acid transporter SnatA (MarC family)
MSGSVWLVAAVVVALLSPPRRAAEMPASGRTRRDRLRAAAAGSVLAAIAYLALAFLASPVLDGLDVSEPNARIAAGLVAVLVGALTLFTSEPDELSGGNGFAVIVVPILFPMLVRAEVAVVVLSASADHGVGPTMVAIAAGLGAFVAWLSASHRIARSVATGVSRVAALIAVAGGVDLLIDGVLAI